MMSQPEIARHCPTCGVSLRERAFFCPQCGKQIPSNPAEATGGKQIPAAKPAEATTERNLSHNARGVEKWRQISSVVLDEAVYDPSLRFILVAAVLFILFLVILIMSELIT